MGFKVLSGPSYNSPHAVLIVEHRASWSGFLAYSFPIVPSHFSRAAIMPTRQIYPTEAGGLMDYIVGTVITLVVVAALVIAAAYQNPQDP
jgi:tellurite resistance protein TehA-like permease